MENIIQKQLDILGTGLEGSRKYLEHEVDIGRLNPVYMTEKQKARLDYELSMIERLGFGATITLFLEIIERIKDKKYFATGDINNSYLCYLLGITNVDSDYYDLPFERFINGNMKYLPTIYLRLEKGSKGKIVKMLQDWYGVNRVVKANDNNEAYFLCPKDMKEAELISETIEKVENDCCWTENISTLNLVELIKLACYEVSLDDTYIFNDSSNKYFAEEEIYHKTKELFKEWICDEPFLEMEQIKEILKDTGYKLVYQEQFIKICEKLFGMSVDKANIYRRTFARYRNKDLEAVKMVLELKYEEVGKKLYKYLRRYVARTINKGHVIGELAMQKHYEKE